MDRCNECEKEPVRCFECEYKQVDGPEPETRERPRQEPIWHNTKVKPKMFARGRL